MTVACWFSYYFFSSSVKSSFEMMKVCQRQSLSNTSTTFSASLEPNISLQDRPSWDIYQDSSVVLGIASEFSHFSIHEDQGKALGDKEKMPPGKWLKDSSETSYASGERWVLYDIPVLTILLHPPIQTWLQTKFTQVIMLALTDGTGQKRGVEPAFKFPRSQFNEGCMGHCRKRLILGGRGFNLALNHQGLETRLLGVSCAFLCWAYFNQTCSSMSIKCLMRFGKEDFLRLGQHPGSQAISWAVL